MKGIVDSLQRALINIAVSKSADSPREEIPVWIDTAFNGGLAIPNALIAELGLRRESSAEAVLADGNSVELETYACFFDWFGESYETQIIASDGKLPLLGTMLLTRHRLVIDYQERTVELH